jgi:2-amino-4-hydroxy-6-hydroxymethyldihydropteridine diphosphokinase
MTEVYLALGSNLGDSRNYIKQAIKMIGQHLNEVQQAPLYLSKPVGHTDQPDFLNTAVRGHTHLGPNELMAELQWIEKKVGRSETFHWGPREIDIDIIFYGDTVLRSSNLNIPHLLFRERAFVLQPLLDLNPDLTDPENGLRLDITLKAVPANDRSALKRLT